MNQSDDRHPPLPSMGRAPDEVTGLTEMLEYYRVVLQRKGSGLSAAQLDTALPPSDLTIGGLINHMAYVEDFWFQDRLRGTDPLEPWASMDWESDPDWEMHNANQLSPEQLFAQFNESVERSRAACFQAESLDQMAVAGHEASGTVFNLRWIMIHMIEEYARHCGHADYIRQSIDGAVDD